MTVMDKERQGQAGRPALLSFGLKTALLGVSLLLSACGGNEGTNDNGPGTGPVDGKGGSLARFTMVGDFLYTVSNSDMQIFSIADPAAPAVFANVNLGRGIETIFHYGDNLYIGANNGMYIYDVSNPGSPDATPIGSYLHATSCDPVVVNGDYAYVTLRSQGNRCGQGNNQLDVLDISDPASPKLIKSLAMQGPRGLGVENGLLFVCDGAAGMKIFNLADPTAPEYAVTVSELDCYDLIPNQNSLVISDPGGILQYEYNNITVSRTSEIKVEVNQ